MIWNLPEISFCDTDTENVEKEIFNAYESATGRTLYPGNPETLFLKTLAYIIAQQRVLINYSAKMNLLAYAESNYLDHLGILLGVERLEAQPATCTIRFEIDEALSFDVTVPQNTRVSPDGNLMFRTKTEAKITVGNTYVDVEAECETAGEIGNGYVPGQINRLVDPVAYITKAENITTSENGSDTESDNNFRERIHIAPESFSVAGPELAYVFHAKSAHQDIIDVAVWSPSPGQVNIAPLMKDGELPSSEILSLVEDAVNDENVRPLTDQVNVQSPSQVNYNVSATYYILKEYSGMVSEIQNSVSQAVNDYLSWQKTKLGRDINPAVLVNYIQNITGVKRVEVLEPTFQSLSVWEVAKEGTITITYGGLEDE